MAATATTSGRSLYYSGGLHLAILLFAVFGLPDLFDIDSEPEPIVVTLEALPISAISNVKPVDAPIIPTPKKPPVRTKVDVPKPPVSKKTEPQREKPVPVPLPKNEKTPPKVEKENTPKEKPEAKEELDKILESVKEDAQKAVDKEAPVTPKESVPEQGARDDNYDPTISLSSSEMDAIRSQISACWRLPAGAENDYQLKVTLNIRLNPDGSLLEVRPSSQDLGRATSSPAFRTAVESAMRAVTLCTPLKNLPTDKYDTWKDFNMIFDPQDKLY